MTQLSRLWRLSDGLESKRQYAEIRVRQLILVYPAYTLWGHRPYPTYQQTYV